MKKTLLLLMGCMMTAMSWAVKADPTPALIKQADGTELTVMTYGDEHLHWSMTTDGVLLSHVGRNYYIAKVSASGELEPTTQLAHEKSLRTTAEQSLIAQQNHARFQEHVKKVQAQKRNITIGTTTPAYFPHTGSPKALVILVQFTDTVFSVKDPKDNFNDYLNAAGKITNRGLREDRNYGSVKKYFSDISDGQFTPQFDVVGPYTLSKASAYYGAGEKDQSSRITEMLQEACTQADAEVDFANYDSNNDGYVDLVYVIYAGYSEATSGNSADCIWPKSGTASVGTYDGKKVSRYGINNELNYYPDYDFTSAPYKRINGIGLFCHEFSHTLGLPDLYTSIKTEDNMALEYWDLMDGGEYTDNGYTPTPYTPWEREVMGWTAIPELTEAQHVELQPDGYAKITQDGTNEYLILHNVRGRQIDANGNVTNGSGWFSRMLGHGMLVYRVDYGTRTAVNLGDYPNNSTKPGITIVPADGLLINSYRVFGNEDKRDTKATDQKPWSQQQYQYSHFGDPYPGSESVSKVDIKTTNGVVLNEVELPYVTELLSVQMNNTKIEKPIYRITEDMTTGVVSFNFLQKDIADNISGITTTTEQRDSRIFSLDGRLMPNGQSLQKGIYIQGNKKFVVR